MNVLNAVKRECVARLGGFMECLCCNETKMQRLTLHHLKYFNDSITYNKFENTNDGRLRYYTNLLIEIEKRPNNFMVLCNNHHNILEQILKLEVRSPYAIMTANKYNLDTPYFLTLEAREL